jgi:large subunit ribosomal protein L9
MSVKERLETEPLEILMPAGENGRLFGSVTSATIAENLEKSGIDVERKQIDIPGKTIKSVGTTKIRVRLYDNQEAELLVEVKPAGAEKKKTEQPEEKAEAKEAAPEPAPERQYEDYDDYDDYDEDEEDYDDYDEE